MASGMRRKALAALLLLLAAVLVPAAVLVERWLGEGLRDQVRETLRREAGLLAEELDRAPPADPSVWTRQVAARAGARVTLIDLDGTVRGDSEVSAADLSRVENHAHRPEVEAALASGEGSAVRHSATVDEDMMYLAVPVGTPPRRVVRVALPLTSVAATVGLAQRAVWAAGALALLLALGAGFALSRWLTRPLIAMTRAARAMADGDFAAPLPPAPADELGDLVRALATLRAQLASRLAELRAEGDKLRTVVDGMSDGVALILEGRIAVANSAFARLLDAHEEVEGRAPLEAVRLPEMAEAIAAALEAQRPAEREAQVGARSLTLRARPLATRAAPQAVVVVHDATDAKRLERIRRELVANASHELRTPVAAVVAAAETLAAGAGDEPEARRTFVDILLRHAHRLSRLTSDLLDLSRLEAGWTPKLEAVELRQAASTVLSALAARAEERKITIETDLPEGLRGAGDRAAVEQILSNLVDNALKYTPVGGTVRVFATEAAGEATIAVADSGPGIAAEHLPRLFERFYRVDEARSRELGGTGLGLAIVKHLAAACNGTVGVESTVGRGTTFTLRLPKA